MRSPERATHPPPPDRSGPSIPHSAAHEICQHPKDRDRKCPTFGNAILPKIVSDGEIRDQIPERHRQIGARRLLELRDFLGCRRRWLLGHGLAAFRLKERRTSSNTFEKSVLDLGHDDPSSATRPAGRHDARPRSMAAHDRNMGLVPVEQPIEVLPSKPLYQEEEKEAEGIPRHVNTKNVISGAETLPDEWKRRSGCDRNQDSDTQGQK